MRQFKGKPLLKWAGGKRKLIAHLSRYIPIHFNRYLEPFLGGGALFFSMNFDGLSLLNDINSELIHFYQWIKLQPLLVMKEIDKMKAFYSENYYYELRNNTQGDPAFLAARTLFLNKTGYNGLFRLNNKGEFNVPFGKRTTCPKIYQEKNIHLSSQKLQKAELFSTDFESFLSMAQRGDFIYCDPPYEPISKTSSFNRYTGKEFTQEDQIRLKKACIKAREKGAVVLISNSFSPFIESLYQDWNKEVIQVKRPINSKVDLRGAVPEFLIYSNEF